MNNTKDISTMSTDELQAELEARKAEEKKAQDAARRKYETDRDVFVGGTVMRMQQLRTMLKDLKKSTVDTANELQERSYTVLGRKRSDKAPDQFTLISDNGKFKLILDRQYKGEYDETADVAIATIKEVLRDKFEGRNKPMYDILDSVLMKNNKGDYDERLVAKLRKHEDRVNDPRFSQALDTLSKAYRSTTSQSYIRAYEMDDGGKWQDISVSFSSM